MAELGINLENLTAEGRKYVDQMNTLMGLEIFVGLQAGATAETESGDEVSLADIAAYNEYGTSTIPPRPFMQQSFENHEGDFNNAAGKLLKTVTDGGNLEVALENLGLYAQKTVRKEIIEGEFEPNAPSTIKKKGSSRPLIDTGTMRQSIDYVIRERSED